MKRRIFIDLIKCRNSYLTLFLCQFRSRVFKGIPQSLRNLLWPSLLLNGTSLSSDTCIPRIEEMMQEGSVNVYEILTETHSGYERQIMLDIQRTMVHHAMFRSRLGDGQKKMTRLLQAFSNYDLNVGYCQGMANIAALFLIYLNDDYICFWMFVELFSQCHLYDLYKPGFPLLNRTDERHTELLLMHAPRIYRHFRRIEITNSIYLVKWMLSAFMCFPFHTSCRLWDVILVFGIEMFPFIAVGLVIILESR